MNKWNLGKNKIMTRSYHTPAGLVVDYGIMFGDKVYKQPDATSITGETKLDGWSVLSEKDQENILLHAGKKTIWGSRAGRLKYIINNGEQVIKDGVAREAKQQKEEREYKLIKERCNRSGELGYGLNAETVKVGETLEWVGDNSIWVVTDKVGEDLYARPFNKPHQAGGFIINKEYKRHSVSL